jgi:hypothetical protein
MKPFNEHIIEILSKAILKDEYSAVEQHKTLHEGALVDGEKHLLQFLQTAISNKVSSTILNIGSGGVGLQSMVGDPVIDLDPCPQRKTDNVVEGWCENIPLRNKGVGIMVCWGTFCFVRSVQETLHEFNRVLDEGGFLVVDTATYSTMPLVQTVNPECFVRYAQLFGFEVWGQQPFGEKYFQRTAFLFKKVEDFNINKLRMPQAVGGVRNYLEERDFYLM